MIHHQSEIFEVDDIVGDSTGYLRFSVFWGPEEEEEDPDQKFQSRPLDVGNALLFQTLTKTLKELKVSWISLDS